SPTLLPVASGTGLNEVLALDAELTSMTKLDAETMTGRGLSVVGTCSIQWGVATEPETKTVWADVGTAGPDVIEANAPVSTRDDSNDVRVPVELLAVPARLVLTSAANLDDVLREFTVARRHPAGLDARVGPLASRLMARSAGVREPVRVAARRAIENGERLVSLTVPTPAAAEGVLTDFLHVIEQLSDHCAEGSMLSLAPTDEVREFRRWYVGEINAQLNGADPTTSPFPAIALDDSRLVEAAAAADLVTVDSAWAAPPNIDDLAAAVGSATDRQGIVNALGGALEAALGTTNVSLCLVTEDGRSLELVEVGYPDDVTGRWSTFPLDADLPASEVVRTGQPMFLRTPAERDARFPIFTRTPILGSGAIGIVPVGRRGALVTGYPEPRPFARADRDTLAAFAAATLAALARIDQPL
ncbi:MAG: hypothetical protein QOD30_67, partial [Actinomycetota bacterium]|nr:hypothetical protein [Actinomycetota bacterium]